MDTEGLPLLGEGGCHSAYRMPDGGVIKIPKLAWRIVCDYSTVAEDTELAREYFGEFLWPTRVERDGDFGGYAIIQPLLPRFEALTKETLDESEELRTQFERLIEANERLYARTGRSFDFFGLEGMVAAMAAEEDPEENAMLQVIRKTFGQLVSKLHLGKDDAPAKVAVSNVLVVDEDGKRRLVIADPTLPNERSNELEAFVFGHTCNFLNKRVMERQFGIEILTAKRSE